MTDLERAIREHRLPGVVLLRPRNALFVGRCFLDAVRLFAKLPGARPESLFPPEPSTKHRAPDIERAAIAHSFTGRLLHSRLFRAHRTCLRRSLLLAHLLRKSGVEVTVCFGVREGGAGLEGHSWLEREGGPFLEENENWRDYASVFTLPRRD